MTDLDQRLAELERSGLYRRLRLVDGPQGAHVLLDGERVLLLCSNNYLGLAEDRRVREAAAAAALRWGAGAGASRLVSGTMTVHRRLEERLAAFERTEACVLFGSGYLANQGVLGALAGPGDIIYSDRLNHASIVDGARLSAARTFVYDHGDCEHLSWALRRGHTQGTGAVIVTDSIFSMDGDAAPLAELAELAERHHARLVVDEAHATGTRGPGGRGAVAGAGLEGVVDVVIGTLGKALGSYGAYVCARRSTVRYLINRARPLIFSTAPPPPAAAAALTALEILESEPALPRRLLRNAAVLRSALSHEGWPKLPSDTHILPLIVGDCADAVRLCESALSEGIFAQAIRPPTVPQGTSRLRLTVMATHETTELQAAARTISGVARDLGVLAASANGGSARAERRAPDASDRAAVTA